MLAFELPTAISSASNALATVLYSDDEKVKRRCQGLKQSDFTTLKRNLAQISYEKELLRSSRTEVASYLDKIALILNDDILEGHYVSSFASNSSQVHVFSPDLARFQTFASFVAVLAEKPPRFEVIEAVRSDATNKLSELSYLLKDFSNVLDDADPEDLEAPYVHETIQALGILIAEIELADDLEHIYRDVPKPGSGFQAEPGFSDALNFEDIEFVRNYYLEIVRPLEEDLVVGANWSWEQIHWRESRELDDCGIAKIIPRSASEDKLRGQGRKVLNILPSLEEEQEHTHVQSLRPHRRHRLLQQPQADGDVVFDAGRCVLASDNVSLSTDDWFAELRDVHKNLNRDRMDSLNEEEMEELVKVAVIDTGIDLDHPDFQAVLKSGQLDLGIDLVDRGERISDLDGHGTHVCHTLLQTAPYVKLYPMRVFRTSKREDCTPNLIKQAIYHAIEIWDVDIISMSFAFEEEEADIKEALRNAKSKASDKNALMFAAASNNRALRINPVGYPARAINRVICVNSSTVHDRPSDFSPEGQPGQPNLSAVGENVEAAWPVSGDAGDETTRKRMSGTSCATPIVAGIAAMVLDFAKKDGPELRSLRDWDVKKGELWETLGMISVLKRCMTAGKDDRSYNFLKPWRLLKEPDFSIIAVKIIEALLSIYALATKCSELFSRWRNSVSTLPNEVMQVENLLFRFNLWAENNSANSEGRDSLDWRLRKSPLPHDVIVDLLEALSAVILRNLAPEKPGAAEHESADALLDQLFRFTRAIRRSGALKRFVRVADHVEYDKDVNLTLKFRECVMPYLDVVLKSTSQELKNRLLDTICLQDELDDIVEESYGILPSGDVFDGCPFCEEYINEPPERFDLVHHVSSHLLELSKISLSGHEFDGHMKADSESNHTTGQGHIASAAASTQKSKRSPDSHSFSINMDVDNDRDEEPDKQESMEHDNDSSPFEERGHRQAHDGLNEATAVEEPALSEGRIRILGDVEANSSAEDGPSPSHRVPRFVVAIHVGAAYSSVAYADLDEPFKDHLITDWGAGPPVEQVRTALFYRDITTSGPPSATRTRSEVESWSPDDVVDWLSLKRVGPHQTQVFRDHNISGEMLLGMDQSSLFNKALDLGDVGGRWDLWYSIKALQDEVNSHPSLWINSTHGGEAFLVEDLGLAPDAEPPALQTYFKLGFFPGAESRLLGSRFETKYTEKALKRTIDQVIYADAAMVSAQVDYILTVPEDWTNSARESLGRSEPEALMAYIASSTPHLGLHKDDVFLVCDAGGCQVTVSTYVVLSMSSIRHTLRRNYADSGLCGDILLDRGFEDYLMSMNYINCKDESEQRLMSRALAHFRSKIKPSFTGMETTPFHITLTEDSAPGHARIFKMPVDDIRNKVFDPVITKVCNLVSHHLHLVDFGKLAVFEDKSGPVKALYLAGGFGQNEYLKRRLQMTVGDEIRVIRVENGSVRYDPDNPVHANNADRVTRYAGSSSLEVMDWFVKKVLKLRLNCYTNLVLGTRPRCSLVKKGERLLEDEPVKFSLMYEIDTREGHELRSITCNIYSSMAEIPPQFLPTAAHPVPDLKLIVTLSIDLNALPPDHVSKHGSRSIVDFDVYMTLRSSEVVFAVGSRDFRLPVAIL
ncbi:subtilase family domain-containing protein [Purpureocillium lavendulum]|uniref:Subtilase family domain-containing protein n=1 Tax=Purpureocillium lavendulum TaxID=1247861 RepID=A0AB34G9F8_9HYPO|nr:subtilase family domain-containing protein [Purpureocillium lavendulum]